MSDNAPHMMDLRIKNGRAQRCIGYHWQYKENDGNKYVKVTLRWRDDILCYLQMKCVQTYPDGWKRLVQLVDINKFPKDEVEVHYYES
jgi:hypothetical protein